jgi:hypothetical protein
MALSFRLDAHEGHLEWRDFNRSDAIDVTKEEAMIVAVAEIAAALRHIAHEMHQIHETVGDSAGAVADAIKRGKP